MILQLVLSNVISEPQSNSSLSCFFLLPWQGIWVLTSWHLGCSQFLQETSFQNEEVWGRYTVTSGSRLVVATVYWHPGTQVGCPFIKHHRASYSGESIWVFGIPPYQAHSSRLLNHIRRNSGQTINDLSPPPRSEDHIEALRLPPLPCTISWPI